MKKVDVYDALEAIDVPVVWDEKTEYITLTVWRHDLVVGEFNLDPDVFTPHERVELERHLRKMGHVNFKLVTDWPLKFREACYE